MNILAVDGGGTKLNAFWTDENLNLISWGCGGGVNTTQTPAEEVAVHIKECLDQLFASGVPDKIDRMYVVFVGPLDLLKQQLEERTKLGQVTTFYEGYGGLLAGAAKTEGFVALAGTGSDVFYLSKEKNYVLGGQGPILGDDGGGAWMGQQAARAVVRDLNGWGEKTQLTRLLFDSWKIDGIWDLVAKIHGAKAPFSLMATITRLIGQAAADGDAVALNIVREAGQVMATQMISLISRMEQMPKDMEITLCGGAWKTHPEMLASFEGEMRKRYPTVTTSRPLFEHVCAGPVQMLIDQGVPRQEIIRRMKKSFPQYCVK